MSFWIWNWFGLQILTVLCLACIPAFAVGAAAPSASTLLIPVQQKPVEEKAIIALMLELHGIQNLLTEARNIGSCSFRCTKLGSPQARFSLTLYRILEVWSNDPKTKPNHFQHVSKTSPMSFSVKGREEPGSRLVSLRE